MRYIDLAQGSPEWTVWRDSLRIGASDAPCIMGVGYNSREDLLAFKLGLKKREVNYHMRMGLKLEPRIRFLFEQQTGLILPPCVGQHDEFDWMIASFDGLSILGDIVLEMKSANPQYHAMAIQGRIPPCYVPQCQHQLFVSGAEICYYYSYCQNKLFGSAKEPSTAIVEVVPDAEYMATLLEEEEKFLREWKSRLNQAEKVSA